MRNKCGGVEAVVLNFKSRDVRPAKEPSLPNFVRLYGEGIRYVKFVGKQSSGSNGMTKMSSCNSVILYDINNNNNNKKRAPFTKYFMTVIDSLWLFFREHRFEK